MCKEYRQIRYALKNIYEALNKISDHSGKGEIAQKKKEISHIYKSFNYNKYRKKLKTKPSKTSSEQGTDSHIPLGAFKNAVYNTYICLYPQSHEGSKLDANYKKYGDSQYFLSVYADDNDNAGERAQNIYIITIDALKENGYIGETSEEKSNRLKKEQELKQAKRKEIKPLIISAWVVVLLCIIGFCITIGIVSGNINEAYVSKIKNDGNFEFTFEEEKVDNETCVVITGLNEERNPKLYEDFSGEVIIPEKIDGKKVIGVAKGAFSCGNKDCDGKCNYYSKITNIIIPDSLEFIAKDAFSCCNNLESFGEEYEGMTFVGLPSLNTVGAHNGYYDNGKNTFNIWLIEVTQSEDEINIDRSYYFDDAVGHKNWVGELKGIANGALGQYDTAENISIPDDVKIGNYNVEFINVEIPGSENGCYKEIKNLDYTWSGSEYFFNNVEDKISLNEPDNVEELSSFYNFAGYYIKENKSTENNSDCIKKDQLKEIDVNEPIYAADFFDKKFTNMTIYAAWTPKTAYSIFDFEIIEKTSKDYYAKINGLEDTSIQKITIPDEVKEISQGAFSGCSALTEIIIPSSVTSIGASAFSGCTNLVIYAVAESKPNGWDSQWNSDNLPVVWGHGTDNEKVELDGFLWKFSDGNAKLIKYSGTSKAVVVEENIVFQSNSYTFTEIAENAFAKDQGIAVFTPLADNSLDFGEIPVVWNYAGTKSDSCLKWGLTTDNKVVIVGHYGYDNNKCIAQVDIPSRITVDDNTTVTKDNIFIAPYAFKNYKISKIDIDRYFCADNIPDSAFKESTITNANIPTSAISKLPIKNLKCVSITLSADITKIGTSAFSGCSNLTSITLPAGITEIGTSAFSGCSKLTSITIPASVKKIGAHAFSCCTELKEVYLECKEGWAAVNGIKVQEFIYLNPDTAANYLTNDYREYTWER